MTRPALTLLTTLALFWQALTGVPQAGATPFAVPICHIADGRSSVPGAPHDCLACPVCAGVTQPPMLVPPTASLRRPDRYDAVAVVVWSARPSAPARTWTAWPRGPPRPI